MKRNGLYFVINQYNYHCGLTDRLKAVVGLYYIARLNKINFKFIHYAGFDIRDYLVPNKVNWSAEISDIPLLPWKREKIKYCPPFDDLPVFQQDKQYVCTRYIGKNILEKKNIPNWQAIWRELFWELFSPSEAVSKELKQSNLPKHYAAVSIRFVNSLGKFEDVQYNSPAPVETQRRIIDATLLKIDGCVKKSNVPVIVYSDSTFFLEVAAKNGFQICDTDGIGNIMNLGMTKQVYLKTFVRLFQLAQADTVYSIRNLDGFPENTLYKSQYPRYAAIIGDKPFIKI